MFNNTDEFTIWKSSISITLVHLNDSHMNSLIYLFYLDILRYI